VRAEEFDYVIAGAGTAGCVLAARLTEDPAIRVCLIEAGGARDRHPFIQVPALVGAAIGRRSLVWGLMTEPQPGLGGRSVPLPRGRVVGGSGSINGMAYFRGQPQDYDDWSAAGNAGWSWAEVLPYFIRSENNLDHRGSPWHGEAGPIHVTHIPRPNPLNHVFLDAFATVGGYPACTDFTGPRPEGYGLRQGTIHRGRRDSSAAAFLRPALSRPNLRLVPRALVTRVLLDGTRATGLAALIDGEPQELRASRETLLCAGAFQSPQLLMLSGIGDPEELETHGIAVRHALRGVGRDLHDHPAAPILRETSNTLSYGLSLPTLPRSAWNLAQYLFARSGPLASNVFESTAFIRSHAGADRPDLQIVFQPARRNPHPFPLPLGHGYAISAVNLYPRSRGRLRLASRDPRALPRIDLNLLGDADDLKPILAGIKLGRRLLDAAPFERFRAKEIAPGPAALDDAALEAYIRRTAATVHHPVSSCRMGRDELAVVDDQLRVRGLDALRVVDASVFPSIVGGNTNAPVVMVAEKAADLLRGRPAPPPLSP
jgi:choline dehydrogenase-like flavoprotein